ncbi:hypothetical protein [Postechiella marina]
MIDFKKISLLVCLMLFAYGSAQNFATKGNGIRNGVIGEAKGKSVFYFSELDGVVSAYSTTGKELWRYKPLSAAVMFKIIAEDVTGDKNDELLAASGDGNIYCWNYKGDLLWQFNPGYKVRFTEVAVVNNNEIQIFVGGNNYLLYELNSKGKLVSETKIDGSVRKIESGNFIHKNKEDLFVMTYGHDKFRWEFFGIIDSNSKEIIKSLSQKKSPLKEMSKVMLTDFKIADINKDGKDDILMFGDVSWKATYIALDANFNVIGKHIANKKDTQRYAHTQGEILKPFKDEVVMKSGSILYVLDLKGNPIHKAGVKYKNNTYSDMVFDAKRNTLFTIGDLGGGNGVYAYNLKNENWFNKNHDNIGRYKEVQDNVVKLYKDVLNFKMPSYQKKSNKPWMMISKHELPSEVKKLNGNDIVFIDNRGTWSENTNRDDLVAKIGKSALKKDKRKKYNLSREEIIERAKLYEAKNEPFVLWAGHGNDPFYTRIETLEAILEVAPKTCYGFIYAEMDDVKDPRVIHFVEEYIPRLAKAIRKHNKAKLYFRYKNMFWALTNNLSPWKNLFFSGEYSDILVPASEDTSSRTQDVNLAGRIGMHSGGYIDDFAMRLIDDNPTSWRPLSPGGQRSVSPYLRQGVLMAAYGGRFGVNFEGTFIEKPGLEVLYALMKSGVLPIVEKEDIRSINSWHLIKDVDAHLIHSVDNHHNLKQYKMDDDDAVFSVAQMHWAGASIPENDYSKIALGVDYRWTNYLPKMPHGMVPIAPFKTATKLQKNKVLYTVSNGKKGFLNNEFVSAKTYQDTFKNIIAKGKAKLPIVVKGASWSAIQIDKKHVRVILLDPGYLDPQEREATISFNGKKPIKGVDILSNEKIKISNAIKLSVPTGALRFVDFEY